MLRKLSLCLCSILLVSCTFFSSPLANLKQMDGGARDALQSRLLENAAQLEFYKALYRVQPSPPEPAFRYAVVFEQPQRLRVEILPNQGFYSLGLFVAEQQNALFIDPSEKKVAISNNPRKLLRRYFALPFAPEEIALILTGRVPMDVLSNSKTGWYDSRKDTAVIRSADETQYFEVRLADGLLHTLQIRDSIIGKVRLSMEIDSYKEVEGVLVADGIRFDVPDEDMQIAVQAKTFKMQRGTDSLFNPTVPAGFRIDKYEDE